MVDQSKRNTLKNVAGIGLGSVAASSGALASLSSNINSQTVQGAMSESLPDIRIESRVSSTTNDLEVVLTNTSLHTKNIVDMAPAEINTARGHFVFSDLFVNGNLKLKAGQSAVVPIQRHAVVGIDSSVVGKPIIGLHSALAKNVSITTDSESLAVIVVKA